MKCHPVFSVEGKVAIITGSGKGIGKALALGFGQAGAKVVVNSSHHPDQGRATLAEIREAGGEAIFIQADVSNQEDVLRIVDETLRIFGRVDILINNAGSCWWQPSRRFEYGRVE